MAVFIVALCIPASPVTSPFVVEHHPPSCVGDLGLIRNHSIFKTIVVCFSNASRDAAQQAFISAGVTDSTIVQAEPAGSIELHSLLYAHQLSPKMYNVVVGRGLHSRRLFDNLRSHVAAWKLAEAAHAPTLILNDNVVLLAGFNLGLSRALSELPSGAQPSAAHDYPWRLPFHHLSERHVLTYSHTLLCRIPDFDILLLTRGPLPPQWPQHSVSVLFISLIA
jgi:hypothetical protein